MPPSDNASGLDRQTVGRLMVLALALFAMGVQTYVFAGVLEPMAKDLGISVGTAGQLSTVFAILYAVLAPVLASQTATWPRRQTLAIALAVIAAVNLLSAVLATFPALVGLRVVAALAACFVQPVAFAAAASLATPQTRGKAMSIVLSGLTLAFVVGIPIGSVVGEALGWQATFAFAGLMAMLAAAAIRFGLPAIAGGARAGLRRLSIGLSSPVAPILVCNALAFAGTFCVFAYIGPVITRVTGFTGSGIAILQGMVGLGSIGGIVVGGMLADKVQSMRPVATIFALLGLVQGLYTVWMISRGIDAAWAPMLMGMTILLNAIAMFSLTPILQARLVAAQPDYANVVIALNGSMMFAGQGLGAGLGGLVQSAPWLGGDLRYLGLLGMAFTLAGALVALTTRSPR